METNEAFGKALRQVRKAKGMSQEDFSMISSRTYLSTLERGLKSPTLEKLEALAEALDVHVLTLLALTYLNMERTDSIDQLLERIVSELESIECLLRN